MGKILLCVELQKYMIVLYFNIDLFDSLTFNCDNCNIILKINYKEGNYVITKALQGSDDQKEFIYSIPISKICLA